LKEDSDFYSAYPRVAEEVLIGPPMLTKYERAKLIGARALQIQYGAPPLIDPGVIGSLDPIDIARYEVDNGILPVTIYRYQKGTGRGQAIPLRLLLEVERRVVGGRVYR